MKNEEGFSRCENKHLVLEVHKKLGWIRVVDKYSGQVWGPGSVSPTIGLLDLGHPIYGGVVSLSNAHHINITESISGNGFFLQFRGFTPVENIDVDIEIMVKVELSGLDVSVIVDKVTLEKGWKLNELQLPFMAFCLDKNDEGYLVLPRQYGEIIPSTFFSSVKPELMKAGVYPSRLRYTLNTNLERAKIWKSVTDLTSEQRKRLPWEKETIYECPTPVKPRRLTERLDSLSMAWFGAVRGKSAYIAINETFEDSHYLLSFGDPAHGEVFTISPIWLASQGQLRYPRKIKYSFIPNGTYVSMCKAYRSHTIRAGIFKSLKEKMEENPQAKKLIGAPIVRFWVMDNFAWYGVKAVSTTYKGMQKILKDMKDNLGITRALVLPAGTQKRGFDNIYPDILPLAEEPGKSSELTEACRLAKQNGYLFGLYDNYMIILMDSPSMKAGQDTLKGPKWSFEGYEINGSAIWQGGQSFSLCPKVAMRYARKNIPLISKELDGLTAYFLDITTAVSLRECCDINHPLTRREDKEYRLKMLKYISEELGMVGGSEGGVFWAMPHTHYMEGIVTHPKYGVPAPLFNLVFHDAVMSYWHIIDSYAQSMDDKLLYDLLCGNPTNWTFNDKLYWQKRSKFGEVVRIASELHKQVALDEMTNHQFLTSDYLVQKSEFSSGRQVCVNFSSSDYKTKEGKIIKTKGYLLS